MTRLRKVALFTETLLKYCLRDTAELYAIQLASATLEHFIVDICSRDINFSCIFF